MSRELKEVMVGDARITGRKACWSAGKTSQALRSKYAWCVTDNKKSFLMVAQRFRGKKAGTESACDRVGGSGGSRACRPRSGFDHLLCSDAFGPRRDLLCTVEG